MKLDFQVGTSKKAHSIMKQLAGRSNDEEDTDDNSKAPFKKMGDAYLFALVLGLTTGNKTKIGKKDFQNVFHFSGVVDDEDYDFSILLECLGDTGDLEDKDSAKKAIQEYATWGLLRLGEQKHGDDDYRIASLLEGLIDN